MMIIGLLLIALICLAVGLVLPSVAWLVASLIATAGAAYLLLKARSTILAPAAGASGVSPGSAVTDDPPAESAESELAESTPGESEMAESTPGESMTAERTADAASHAISPDAATTVMPALAADSNQMWSAHSPAGEVWVIDGRPRFHLASCAIIQGQDAEPIPFDQATEDGFMPCSLCEPNAVRAAR
jgi:hypothetical protein